MILFKADEPLEFDPTRIVMENFCVTMGQVVDDVIWVDIESYPLDIPGIVERGFEWSERITDRIGE